MEISEAGTAKATEFEEADNEPVSNSNVSTKNSIPVRISKATARSPCMYLLFSLAFTIALTSVAYLAGDFSLEVDNRGWTSRGTLIADRQYQLYTLTQNRFNLFYNNDAMTWESVRTELQEGIDGEANSRRKLEWEESELYETLKEISPSCDPYWIQDIFWSNNLIALWKTNGDSLLDGEAMLNICQAETDVISVLEEGGFCTGCDDDSCPPPVSIIYGLRIYLGELKSSCQDLINKYTPSVQSTFTEVLANCTDYIRSNYSPDNGPYGSVDGIDACPYWYSTVFVDESFSMNNTNLRYTSSYFSARYRDGMYEVVEDFPRLKGSVEVYYDTNDEDFAITYSDDVLISDMVLATVAGAVSVIALMVHTKSLWLAFMGILQIIFSIPLAYFIYYFIAGLTFFPFLNFIGIFVLFALGADDVFVAVDKWKNARLGMPKATTEEVAAVALPDAAGAMLLTTSTTAVAFFATAICPVAPITCFVVYCGLLIMVDYFLNIILVFPALCLYDKWIMSGRANCFVTFCRKKDIQSDEENSEKDTDNNVLIWRILEQYYYLLHKLRFVLGIGSIAAVIICALFARNLSLPESADVRILPSSNVYEQHFLSRQKLFSTYLEGSSGSEVRVVWGLRPADTGNHNDPATGTTLELDNTFNPSSTEAQNYLVNFCDRLFKTDFASKPFAEYDCPINQFDSWLQEQSSSEYPSYEYESNCGGATSIPVSEDLFDPCFIVWSKINDEFSVLDEEGEIQTMIIVSSSSARFNSPYDVLDKEWKKYEEWFKNERNEVAPEGVNKMFHSSFDFLWYDTNGKMLQTAISASAIAVGFSAFVVLIASRSFVLTFFSTIAIAYVLIATTASIVGVGWDLGFLESICFAILIGLSCDFVIHFSHAYKHYPGYRSRNERTKYALIHMGPSILAAATTTVVAAIVMLFTTITFFTKFATILLFTIIHSIVATFVVFLVLCDMFGPSEPTKFFDMVVAKCSKTGKKTVG